MNRIIRYLVYLIVFCLVSVIVKYLFAMIKGQNVESIDYILSAGFGFVMWLYYLFSGKLKESEKKKD
ncbi:hypothetical protein F7018_00170 [Tenacibaculum aiptasiae]|uniref:Uncharacterized protein n=1 Tax=Tenacibaculum aiptasiae TaxID=426481 RepID=A0A7J5ARQ7_9FLAO|nr:hypothetical protein [Tenacibaculum aiptasiae]KAB1160326.1 hypothetical protein F7018_00170 [Tenacibaculum aiptasiae]